MGASAGSVEGYSKHYSAASDDDLILWAGDVISLMPHAREALRVEMERRQLATGSVDWLAQPAVEAPPSGTAHGAFGRAIRNFAIFLGCGILYSIAFAAVASQVRGVDIWLFAAGATEFVLRLSLLLTVLIAQPIIVPKRFIPQRLRSVIAVGFAAPLVALVAFAMVSVLHLGIFLRRALWPAVIVWLVYGWWRDKKRETVA